MTFTKLSKEIQKVLLEEGLITPTPIQEKAIPVILDRKDMVGIAQTGTGKTASFVLPILNLFSTYSERLKAKHPKVLILAPTRELVSQISDAIQTYSKGTNISHVAIFGGVSQDPQAKALHKGVHIVVATPGRLFDLIKQKKVFLSEVEFVVLDEAHTMLDMGFIDEIKEIYQQVSSTRQSAFFSATTSPEIIRLAKELLHNPEIIEIESETASDLIKQKVCFVYVENKNALLLELIRQTEKTIIFLRTKYKTDVVQKMLVKNGIKAVAIHSDKTQEERDAAIKEFKSNICKVLVATDIAARGIHIDNISHVINYDVPNSPDVYVHRIGRTARAGEHGVAYSFCGLEEREYIRKIQKYTGQEIEIVKNSFHADKIENLTAQEYEQRPKRKKNSPKVMLKKRVKESEVYVPPINKKKGKKPRGLSRDPKTGKYKK